MGITEGIHYIAIGNPVSKAIIGTTSSLFYQGAKTPVAATVKTTADVVPQKVASIVMPPLWKLAGRHYNIVRLAGLSGASAVVLGAVGSHFPYQHADKAEAKAIFETANRFHFFHSLALLGMPLVKRPLLTASLMITGTALFTGVLYYRAFTGDKKFSRLAPMGGTLLIIAWLSLLF